MILDLKQSQIKCYVDRAILKGPNPFFQIREIFKLSVFNFFLTVNDSKIIHYIFNSEIKFNSKIM